MGAHVAVDPAEEQAFDVWAREGGGRPLVVFEAIGVPGIIDGTLRSAPPKTRIVVVGVCMERDAITPFFAIGKELNLQFVLGYDPMEFEASLRSIAEGEIDVEPMITGRVGLDGVPDAFRALTNPEDHCKILVTP
jgi:threonine dehydrogenase-like Zn-dependent dehydrogenase